VRNSYILPGQSLTEVTAILDAIKNITQGDVRLRSQSSALYLLFLQWKVLVIDEGAKKIIDNVVKEDDILNENIASM
jgi:syntaxin-binding protein 1